MDSYFILGLAIVCNAVGNILIKLSSEQFAVAIMDFVQKPWLIFYNVQLCVGIFFFVLALGLYTKVLSEMNLSIAYPIMTSLGFVIVVAFSVFSLGERFEWWQCIGLVLIIGGVYLLSQTGSHA